MIGGRGAGIRSGCGSDVTGRHPYRRFGADYPCLGRPRGRRISTDVLNPPEQRSHIANTGGSDTAPIVGRAGGSSARVHVRRHHGCAGNDRRFRWHPALLPKSGGCRSQGLYFSLTLPLEPVFSTLSPMGQVEADGQRHPTGGADHQQHLFSAINLSVSIDLAPKIHGTVLDFAEYNDLQRFIWLTLPAAKGPQCTCRRSIGTPTGNWPRCLDNQRLGLSDL